MNTKFSWIVFVLGAALLLAGCAPKARVGELRSESQSVELNDAGPVRVEIEFGAGDLVVDGGSDKLLEAGFTYNVARLKPEVERSEDRLIIAQPSDLGLPDLRGITNFRNEWDLLLSDQAPIDLTIHVGGGSSDLRLADLSLTGLDITLGAGNSTIDLSGDWERDLDATIDAGATDLRLVLPEDVGVRVAIDAGPTLINASGLFKDGNVYTNRAYGMSDVTLQVNMSTAIGFLTLDVE